MTASPAVCMVYMWTDSSGIAHYTNKEHEIPSRFKGKVKQLYPEPADAARPNIQNTQEQQKPVEMAVIAQPAVPPSPALTPVETPAPPVAATPAVTNIPKVRKRIPRRDSESSE